MATAKKRAVRNTARGATIRVHDPVALGVLVTRAIERDYQGSQSLAAERIGLSQPALSRFVRAKTLQVSESTLAVLATLIGETHEAELYEAVCDAAQREKLDAYTEWLLGEIDRLSTGALTREPRKPKRPIRTDLIDRVGTLARLTGILQHRFPDEFAPLWEMMGRRSFHRHRGTLALTRIIAPLFAAFETGAIERAVGEFSAQELRAFVRAGVQRELFLLRRQGDVARTQRAPTASPSGLSFRGKPRLRANHPTISRSPWGPVSGGEEWLDVMKLTGMSARRDAEMSDLGLPIEVQANESRTTR